MFKLYEVGGKLLKAVHSFYVDNKAGVNIRNEVNEWFSVNVGIHQYCVMSPWLFNLYMDGVVRGGACNNTWKRSTVDW